MRAVILAGGKGTRLLPYTTVFPKPLMPIGDMPILEVVLRQLKGAGITRVTMAVGHLVELLQAFFGDGARLGRARYLEVGHYWDLPTLAKTLVGPRERVVAYPFSGYWLDMGRPGDYGRAVEEFRTAPRRAGGPPPADVLNVRLPDWLRNR